MRRLLLAVSLLCSVGACANSRPHASAPSPVKAAPPPKDDGKQSRGGEGGAAHAAALEQLRTAPLSVRWDKQRSVIIPLPDGHRWTRVRFLTMPSLVGFRYGKDHHAIVGAFTTDAPDSADSSSCMKRFEDWAMPFVEAFEVELERQPPRAFAWDGASPAAERHHRIIEADVLRARTATVLSHESFSVAYAAYPAWDHRCLVVGVAVPERDDDDRAAAVRDRFASEVLPRLHIVSAAEPPERF